MTNLEAVLLVLVSMLTLYVIYLRDDRDDWRYQALENRQWALDAEDRATYAEYNRRRGDIFDLAADETQSHPRQQCMN